MVSTPEMVAPSDMPTSTLSLPSTPPSLTDLPRDMVMEVMKRLARKSCTSYFSARGACALLRNVGEEKAVIRHLMVTQLPLFLEERNPVVKQIMDRCLQLDTARTGKQKLVSECDMFNARAMFRVAIVNLFCDGGDYKIGYRLLRRAALRSCHEAVYLWSLALIAHPGNVKANMALHVWATFYTEDKVTRFRARFVKWFPSLKAKLRKGGVFRVKRFTACSSHPPHDKIPSKCARCRVDLELKWFVESLGRSYLVN